MDLNKFVLFINDGRIDHEKRLRNVTDVPAANGIDEYLGGATGIGSQLDVNGRLCGTHAFTQTNKLTQ